MTQVILHALRDPVIVVFLLAGSFDLLSGDPIMHGGALFAVALALCGDLVRRRRATPALTPDRGAAGAPRAEAWTLARVRPSPLLLFGGTSYAVLVGGFARYSWPVTLAVFAPATASVAIAWRGPAQADTAAGPARERERIEPGGVAAWALVFLALALWELAALLLQPALTTGSYNHPTISVLMDPVLATHAGRSVVLFAWLLSGWALLRR